MSKAILILAAGSSSRLGKPKQTLIWKGKTLIEDAIEKGFGEHKPIFVITGGNKIKISPYISPNTATEIYFPLWKEGMGSSLSFGLKEVKKRIPSLKKIMVLLSDMPLITKQHLTQLWDAAEQHSIVLSQHENIKGVPAIFDQSLFSEIMKLKGDQGAKQFLKNYKSEIKIIPSSTPFFDIDTEEDYKKLLEIEQTQSV